MPIFGNSVYDGIIVRMPWNAPRLNGNRQVPFDVHDSAKTANGGKSIHRSSIIRYLSIMVSTILSRSSCVPLREMYSDCRPSVILLRPGTSRISILGVKPGWTGDAISA